MRDFEQRQLVTRLNLRAAEQIFLDREEFADKMPQTEETYLRSGLMGRISWPAVILCFLVSGVTVSAAPQAEQKKEELPHPKTLEELQKAMKEVVGKNQVTGAG